MNSRFFVWAAIVGLFLDQVTKIVVYGMFRGGVFSDTRMVRLLGNVLKLAYEQNQQGVFGLHYGPQFLYFVLPLSASALVIWYGFRVKDAWSAAAFGMILSGALGNVIDRARLGYVIDFIVFELRRLGFQWYTFNIADALVVVGVIMLLGKEFIWRPKPVPATGAVSAPAEAEGGHE
ncbi:MAG: signal peptidase II [candidate division WOR-3 bacterium]|nr:signal peptidase II [candidate division WOR-3 bacterium]